ncbi:hypothetical protein HPP92_011210 [Vanilla planifolia]|uniref:Uncharacterized protein n=1 Tax=Vanilla planifolia TaxID=51239 RepID=A0A835UZZ3_VANPL|nr:hypothetical protein HPP92_011210 [Vanilla planifolia]
MEIITRPNLLFLDEPTSGLDGAAAFHFMSRIWRMAESERMTVVAAVHQPTAEVFDVFSSVCLLAYGRTVFFGPPAHAVEFFASNGFPCPSLKTPSDHYLRTINKDFEGNVDEDPKDNTLLSTTDAIEILVKSYPSTATSQQALLQISNIRKTVGDISKKRTQTRLVMQCLVLTRRSFINMFRDLGYYWLRLGIYVAVSLCVGTIYYQVGHSFGSIQARGSMLMFIAAFLTFMAVGGFPSFVEEMRILGRERFNGYYDVTAFTLANTLSSTPYLAIISVVPGAIAYYLVGLQSSIDQFIYFVLVLFACMMLVEGLMMTVASIVPDFLVGIITGAGELPTITGEQILRDTWQVEMGHSKWVDLAILFGMTIFYRILLLVIMKAWPKMKGYMTRLPRESTSVSSTYP